MQERMRGIRRNIDEAYRLMREGDFKEIKKGVEVIKITEADLGRLFRMSKNLKEGDTRKEVREFILKTQKELMLILSKITEATLRGGLEKEG